MTLSHVLLSFHIVISVNGKDVWATALVLAFLQTKASGRADEWELMAQKAREWMNMQAPGEVDAIIDSAKAITATA